MIYHTRESIGMIDRSALDREEPLPAWRISLLVGFSCLRLMVLPEITMHRADSQNDRNGIPRVSSGQSSARALVEIFINLAMLNSRAGKKVTTARRVRCVFRIRTRQTHIGGDFGGRGRSKEIIPITANAISQNRFISGKARDCKRWTNSLSSLRRGFPTFFLEKNCLINKPRVSFFRFDIVANVSVAQIGFLASCLWNIGV